MQWVKDLPIIIKTVMICTTQATLYKLTNLKLVTSLISVQSINSLNDTQCLWDQTSRKKGDQGQRQNEMLCQIPVCSDISVTTAYNGESSIEFWLCSPFSLLDQLGKKLSTSSIVWQGLSSFGQRRTNFSILHLLDSFRIFCIPYLFCCEPIEWAWKTRNDFKICKNRDSKCFRILFPFNSNTWAVSSTYFLTIWSLTCLHTFSLLIPILSFKIANFLNHLYFI